MDQTKKKYFWILMATLVIIGYADDTKDIKKLKKTWKNWRKKTRKSSNNFKHWTQIMKFSFKL